MFHIKRMKGVTNLITPKENVICWIIYNAWSFHSGAERKFVFIFIFFFDIFDLFPFLYLQMLEISFVGCVYR